MFELCKTCSLLPHVYLVVCFPRQPWYLHPEKEKKKKKLIQARFLI